MEREQRIGCFRFRLGSTLISENETIPTDENNLKVTGPTQEVGKKNLTNFD